MKFSNAFPNSSFKPIEIVENVGENAYRLSVLPYMHIYLVVNLENMKLYEPSMLDQEENMHYLL